MRLDLPRPASADVLAGASVALVLIPQSLAYAELAGLPPFIGLFASAFPLLAFSLFASSPYLQTGPTAVMSLLTFAALPNDDPAQLPKLAALLAIMVGCFRLLFGAARIGVLVRLIALPVVTGFTSGAAILIISSQLPRSLGVSSGDDGVISEAVSAILAPSDWRLDSIVLAVITVVLFLGGRRLHPLFPGVLVAVVVGIVWSRVGDYDGPVVAEVPEGLPPFSLDLPWGEIPTLLLGALVISLIGFAEPVSIARTFANEEGERWDANREFMASGVANAVSAVAGGYPVGGSFSRSSVNKLAGATTRWAGGVTGLVVLAFLPFAGVLEPLPRAVLGAIVLGAVWSLVRPRRLLGLWRRSRRQATLAWIVFGATLAVAPRVELAVLLGVFVTLALHIRAGLRVGHEMARDRVVVRPVGLLWFGSDAAFARELDIAVDQAIALGVDVQVDLSRQAFVDDATIVAMRSAAERLAEHDRKLSWFDPPGGTERLLASLAADTGTDPAAGSGEAE
ncbi:MAG: SulP family inorganic anion transporter [Actinomycetota bacterium]